MPTELLILRHGKSDWSQDLEDFHRPLIDRGKRDAQRIGTWLLKQSLVPDRIASSPAERAIVTAEKAVKAMGLAAACIVRDARIYGASLADLMDLLLTTPETTQRLLLVGHNPGLESLLSYLVARDIPIPEDGKLLPTATLARLRFDTEWSALTAGSGKLLSITRPSGLPRKFPFPAPDGKEQRDRPAYYYRQSSVIPYRLNEGVVEILVISSSKKKHLVVPKGISDPGLTPQQSAAKEAMEEAGAEGEVSTEPLGSYHYPKWGASCSVEVYAMKVTKMIDESEWQERHRGRSWVTPEEAAARLKQRELAPMVDKLAAGLRRGEG